MLKNNSRKIMDAQQGIHKNLEKILLKHAQNEYQKPIAEHTQYAFDSVKDRVEEAIQRGKPLIFDSCCGTAMSTQIIAQDNPQALVLGIDRSSVRLSKEANSTLPESVLLIQAECADFWLLATEAGWTLDKHTILYPNPYPKAKHLKRRWHGHPSFPILLKLGGELELRTNWKVYADEFCFALNFLNATDEKRYDVKKFQVENPLTLFEKKYAEGGQDLYRVQMVSVFSL